ncbi:Hsp20/alpha crystallin family protein [Salinisphaera sp. USBA-960]|uniref:Hsp20/alpha crystallin family protein n=1 Tax=Salinisphaera orenii TaxID=856731 RepID=UPI000DBE61B2|nr:Hsp20/alpha crystallin family protein [Salifodinibacter halophilus]NNC26171.1 Hsp20/alpha crystallin family protein [Salifodinibacter halophilus]
MAKKTSSSSRREHKPFRGFMDFMSEMNRAQTQFMLQHSGGDASAANSGAAAHSHAYIPLADIFAQGNDLVIRCEVPGVRQDDIHLAVTNGVLTISGERHSELDEDHVAYYARERSYGDFRRDMMLPDGVKSNDVTAHTHNGLLEIVIAGGAASKTNDISITAKGDS